MQLWIKICGIKDITTAKLIESLGFSAIGLNFYKPSKRYITPQKAAEISSALQQIQKVGIFVNSSMEDILDIISQVNLDILQLHGDESPEFISKLPPIRVIKAFQATKDLKDKITPYLELPLFGIIIDTPSKNFGGSGKTFKWEDFLFLRELQIPIIIAGGLNTENFCRPLKILKPFGLDFNSGLEKTAGTKDHKKIKLLSQRLKEEKCSD